MARRKSEERLDPMQRFAMPLTRELYLREVEIGIGHLGKDLDRLTCGCCGLVVAAECVEQMGAITMRLGIAGMKRQRLLVVQLRAVEPSHPHIGIAKVVVRL